MRKLSLIYKTNQLIFLLLLYQYTQYIHTSDYLKCIKKNFIQILFSSSKIFAVFYKKYVDQQLQYCANNSYPTPLTLATHARQCATRACHIHTATTSDLQESRTDISTLARGVAVQPLAQRPSPSAAQQQQQQQRHPSIPVCGGAATAGRRGCC